MTLFDYVMCIDFDLNTQQVMTDAYDQSIGTIQLFKGRSLYPAPFPHRPRQKRGKAVGYPVALLSLLIFVTIDRIITYLHTSCFH